MVIKKIGTIDSISEIVLNKKIIVSGCVDRTGWMWRMPGVFKRNRDDIVFEDDILGMKRKVVEDEIGLNVLSVN